MTDIGNIVEISDNIDNIKGNIDEYPQNSIVIEDNTTPNCPSNPPLEKLKWNKFSDIEKAKSIVRLPNLTDSQPLSGKELKGKRRIFRGRKYKKSEKKEEVELSNGQNRITQYFKKDVPSITKFGKRKLQDQDYAMSKKIRGGSSDYGTGDR